MVGIAGVGTVGLRLLAAIVVAVQMVGCVSIKNPEPIHWQEGEGVTLKQTLPEHLPRGVSRVKDAQFVYVHAKHGSELAVSALVPIPFVTDAAVAAYNEGGTTNAMLSMHTSAPMR